MTIIGVTIIEQYYKREIRLLEGLYERKVKRLQKAESQEDHGLIIILFDEVEAIKCALVAGQLLSQTYESYLGDFSDKVKASEQKANEWKRHLDFILNDISPLEIEELKTILCQP